MSKIKSIGVYCGSRETVDPDYLAAASQLGKIFAENGRQLVYGGGKLGLMGRVARGVLDNGGKVVGVSTFHLESTEVIQPGMTETYVEATMHERKARMMDRADGFVIMPGGYGTLEEFFEILTWKQIKIHDAPIVIANLKGYWDPLLSLMTYIIQEKFADEGNLELVTFVDRIEDVLPALDNAPGACVMPPHTEHI